MSINFVRWHWSGTEMLTDRWIKAHLEKARRNGYKERLIKFSIALPSYSDISSPILVLYNSASYPVVAYHLVSKVVFDLFNSFSYAFLKKDLKREYLEDSGRIVKEYQVKLMGDYQADYERIRQAILKSELNLIWYLNRV